MRREKSVVNNLHENAAHASGGHRNFRTLRKVAAAGLAGAVVYQGLLHVEEIRSALHRSTPQEKFIMHALKDAIPPGINPLRCTNLLQKEGALGQTRLNVVGSKVLVVTQSLDNRACDDITNYAGLADKSNITLQQAWSINAAVHEVEHSRFESTNEYATQCRAFQDMPKLARALGATAKDVDMVNRANMFNYQINTRYVTSECRDGGPYDLDPKHVNVFPFPHPDEIKFKNYAIHVGVAR